MDPISDPHARLQAALREPLGDDGVLTGDALQQRPLADWSGAPCAVPRALLLPRTPAQLAQALRVCSAFRQPVSIQGGLTGLAGGANPQAGEVALSLSRLNAIEDFDELGGTVVVQAGVTLQQLQEHAAERGWFFPVDLGARGSCQLGGNTATNAGGTGCEAPLLEVEQLVYGAVETVGGSISAEHGIGVIKRPFLHHSRDVAQLDVMRRLKQALDPAGILAPGRVVQATG